MADICIGMLPDRTLCTKRANRSGYCRSCDPETKKEQIKAAKKQAEKDAKDEQRNEIFQQDLKHMILECRTHEDLRKLELKIMEGLIDGSIADPRVGSPIVQILKHQEDLLDRAAPDKDDLKPHEREKAIKIAISMSEDQMLALIGDFAHGLKNLVRQAKEEAQAVPVITLREGEYEQLEDTNS